MHTRFTYTALLCALLQFVLVAQAWSGPALSHNEKLTTNFFKTITSSPPMLRGVLQTMPKGANLHSHLVGEVYAEEYLQWAAESGLCIDSTHYALRKAGHAQKCPQGTFPARNALASQPLYDAVINALSIRNTKNQPPLAGHDAFFATFERFVAATEPTVNLLTTVVKNLERAHVSHAELMHGFYPENLAAIAKSVGWNGDANATYEKLRNAGLFDGIASARTQIRTLLADTEKQLGRPFPVSVNFISQVIRTQEPAVVFAQLAYSFELVRQAPAVTGLTMVAPEDSYIARRDYTLHREMIDALYTMQQYHNTNITLHAGELTLGLVPPEDLTDHIWQAVTKGHAKRIGHGVSIMHEETPFALLKYMRNNGISVEICLTSNDNILNIKGADHPLPVYMRFGVPVSLNTDDAGVSRSDITEEYVRAVSEFGLDYGTLKNISRSSLEYSFLNGKSIWAPSPATTIFTLGKECRDSLIGHETAPCKKLLNESPKAALQWELEKRFTEFERNIAETFTAR